MPAHQIINIKDLSVWLGLHGAGGQVVDVHFVVLPLQHCLQVEVLDVQLVEHAGWGKAAADPSGASAGSGAADAACKRIVALSGDRLADG